MKLDKKPEIQVSAAKNAFSKCADYNVPDSPPPEKVEEPEEGGMNKFERMMKAAVSIKSAELESKRKKFEKLPMFLKAGVYYSTKLDILRKQEYFLKIFAFDLMRKEGNEEFGKKQYDRACRKYEEALSIFRYYYSLNPKWSEQGIDDNDLKEVDDFGSNEYERSEIKRLKLQMFLNIAACNLKTNDFETAFDACNEALKLDPYSIKALYRRGRSKSLPINAGVEEFRVALSDMKRILEIDPNHIPAQRELKKLQRLIDVNRKREKDTYGKMFNTKKSISEYVEEKTLKEPISYKTLEDKEYEKEKVKMEKKVKKMMEQKMMEFSFEVSEEKKHFKEMDDIQEMIDKAEESYRLFKKTGRIKESRLIKKKLEEARYAKEHLLHVMNLDFSRPTHKMKELAKQHNIDLHDSSVIEEFKKIQRQNLEDIRRMKEGKQPLTEEELKQKLKDERNESSPINVKNLEEQKTLQIKKAHETGEEQMKTLLKNVDELKTNTVQKQAMQDLRKEQIKHYLVLCSFVLVWVAFIIYQNFIQS